METLWIVSPLRVTEKEIGVAVKGAFLLVVQVFCRKVGDVENVTPY